MMNAKERGVSPFRGTAQDRLPMWYCASDEITKGLVSLLHVSSPEEALYEKLEIDYKFLSPNYTGKPLQGYADGSYDTIWGIRRAGSFYGQAVTHPLAYASTVKDIEAYPFPHADEWNTSINNAALNEVKDYCTFYSGSQFFHDAMELLGTEAFMYGLYDCPEVIEGLLEQCSEFYYGLNSAFFSSNPGIIDIAMMNNDFGSQRGLMFSSEMWRKFVKPHLAKHVNLMHKHNVYAVLHSCGDIHEIIPDLIDIGFDALNPIQVNASNMDPVVLKSEYGKDIVFFGGIDENEILLHQTPQQVRDETRRIIDILGSDGKYIVAPSHDYLLPEVPISNVFAMYDEAKYYGKRKSHK